MAGKLPSQKGLIVEVDVKGYLAATNDVTDRGLYVENNANMKQVPYITCVNIPVLFYDLRHHPHAAAIDGTCVRQPAYVSGWAATGL